MNDPTPPAALIPLLAEALPPAPVRPGWRQRLADAVDEASAWLPVLLMAGVALGTWWLVKHTPLLEAGRAAAAPRHEPDYTMTGFQVQRFGADGALKIEIVGERMRHFPDTDTYEIDHPRLRLIGSDGRVTSAVARSALSNRDASQVQLSGGAHVVREAGTTAAGAAEPALEFEGQFLDVEQPTEQVRSHLPVTVTEGPNVLRADGMHYDHLRRVLDLTGKVRAVLAAPGTAPRR